jgi:hypothetical protein
LVALLLFITSGCSEKERERMVTETEVPQAILQAFVNTYPEAKVKEYAEENEEGQAFYEVSFEFEGRAIDVTYTLDGTVYAIEEVIRKEELPSGISEALVEEFGEVEIALVEKVDKEGQRSYEIKFLAVKTNTKYEVKYDEIGKVIEKEKIRTEEEY